MEALKKGVKNTAQLLKELPSSIWFNHLFKILMGFKLEDGQLALCFIRTIAACQSYIIKESWMKTILPENH